MEGIITIVCAIPCFYFLPDSYEQARWLNEQEKEIMRRRVENEKIYAAQEKFDWAEIRRGLLSPRIYLK